MANGVVDKESLIIKSVLISNGRKLRFCYSEAPVSPAQAPSMQREIRLYSTVRW